ncbi:hypothetical protein GQX74_000623 [Glossina fuscipes]|nr:hypothetical protein GQX74_000623 [Glossina fuscipes]
MQRNNNDPRDEHVPLSPCYKCKKRKYYERRVARLEKQWDNFKLSADVTASKFIAMERRVKDLIKEKQILEQKLQDINDKMRCAQVMNSEEEWQEMDDSYDECVSTFSQESEGSFLLSPNTNKIKCQPSPQTAAAFDQHLLLCFNCKTQRAKDGKSQHKAGEERSKRSKGAGNQRRLSWDLRDTENEKECASPSADEICDYEELNYLSQRTNSDEKPELEKCLAKRVGSRMEWESRQNDNDNDNDSEEACEYARKDETYDCEVAKACVSPPNDEIYDCEIVNRKSQHIYNEYEVG